MNIDQLTWEVGSLVTREAVYYSLTVLQATFDNAPAEPGHALLLAGLVLGSVPDQKGNKLLA